MLKKHLKWIIPVVAIALVAGGFAVWKLMLSNDTSSEPTTQTLTATVEQTDETSTVAGTGTLAAKAQETLSFSASGTVNAVLVKAGDLVEAGASLATLETTSLSAAVTTATAQVDSAQTKADEDGSDSDLQQKANSASLAVAKQELTDAEADLASATLTATFSGMIAEVNYTVGDSIGGESGAADSSSSGIVLMTADQFVVSVAFDSSDVTSIATEMSASVELASGETYEALVTAVSDLPTVDSSGSATFPVTVEITGAQTDIYVGTSATVTITTATEAVLTVPSEAITTTNGVAYVEKIVDEESVKTEVEVGESYGRNIAIVSGLSEGDTVEYTTTSFQPGAASGESSTEQGGMPTGGTGDFQPPTDMTANGGGN